MTRPPAKVFIQCLGESLGAIDQGASKRNERLASGCEIQLAITVPGGRASMGVSRSCITQASAKDRAVFGCSVIMRRLIAGGTLDELGLTAPCGLASVRLPSAPVGGTPLRDASADEAVLAFRAALATGEDFIAVFVLPPPGYAPEAPELEGRTMRDARDAREAHEAR